ncbi:MAG: energy-coupling factor transporter transmembrane protein EcfT [Lachnospiraceae bacterium]|uniref:Energy-coupling factor transporter transmembrane protein EcfT n=1 Tax=Candidatus Weimeria bifida TaxID=2599074 RepID=A0A6N7IZ99_9FIRM|nr:energy-coupling factor transporter transmembrane protein EcfT [Candidatus Weimeria bifida]RRF96708.1 MAG: energy-coupling factor transporter transmembrane protein EcfT [Lachnospiraceae bacterium]
MLKDITLGQYYQVDSVIHRLDPRVKLVATLFFIISIFVADDPIGFIFLTVCLFAIIALSKVPFSFMVRGLKSIIILLLICGLFNLFLTPGDAIVKWGKVQITIQGVRAAILMLVRMIYLIIGTSIMTLTTTPNQLTDGLETGLRALNYIHVPVHEIAMMMSIALRFIPILNDETDKIMKAQMARGASFDGKGIVNKAKAMVPLLVPLFVSAFRRANDLALAMEARCYHGGEGRTSMKPLHYRRRDVMGYFYIFGAFAVVIVLHIIF